MQIKFTMRFHAHLLERLGLKNKMKQAIQSVGKDVTQLELSHAAGGMQNVFDNKKETTTDISYDTKEVQKPRE